MRRPCAGPVRRPASQLCCHCACGLLLTCFSHLPDITCRSLTALTRLEMHGLFSPAAASASLANLHSYATLTNLVDLDLSNTPIYEGLITTRCV